MNQEEALARMVAPGTRRPGKYREGVIQIWATRACNLSCFGCTQASNLAGDPGKISLEQFEAAVQSLRGWWGVVGLFGGNPATHPQFVELCQILRGYFPREQLGLWCNDPLTQEKAQAARATFDPSVSNLNVHLVTGAYQRFRDWWPESQPFGEGRDSRHSPVYVSMRDLGLTEEQRWALISTCDINQHWSAMLGVFRGQLRAWFCEIAGSMSMLRQDDPAFPDTGLDPTLTYGDEEKAWWQLPMSRFADQVNAHCHDCGVPMRGYGELAVSRPDGVEQTSATWQGVFRPKRPNRRVELVTTAAQLKAGTLTRTTDYLGNGAR